MVEKTLDTFTQSIINYFHSTYNIDVNIGSPYLISDLDELNGDYTGVINISGQYNGSCYFSTPKTLLQQILSSLEIGIDINSDEVLGDIAGEIANTLSGNARAELGENFIISIPKVFRGTSSIEALTEKDTSEERTYAIPVVWKSEKAFLGVNLA